MIRKSPSRKIKTVESAVTADRRKFLKAASGVAGGAVLGFPMIAKGQTGPISMRPAMLETVPTGRPVAPEPFTAFHVTPESVEL